MSDRHLAAPIFKVSSHDGLIAALVARRKQLGLSQLDVDEISGLQPGYTAKIECGTKRVGYLSLTLLLGALKLDLEAVPASGPSVAASSGSAKSENDPAAYIETTNNFFVERARKGARVLNARLTAKQRRENGRKGGRKRWANWRAARAEQAAKAEREAKR
jgi:transcriptional regulator with XRE-family HTH domain